MNRFKLHANARSSTTTLITTLTVQNHYVDGAAALTTLRS